MSQRFAILIGIEQVAGREIPFAESDAQSLSEVLPNIGFPVGNVIALLGSGATRTGIDSRLRKLAKLVQPGDELFFFYFGSATIVGEQSYLATHDSDVDDLEATSLTLTDLWNQFATHGVQLRVLLDVEVTETLEVEIESLFEEHPQSLILLSSQVGETSQVADSLGHRLWGYHLIQALSGAAKIKNLGKDRILTSELLWNYLHAELPRTARKILAEPKKQHPMQWGAISSDIVFADLKRIPAEKEARTSIPVDQARRIIFRTQSTTKVKDLKGYQKGHRLPEQVTPSAKKFIARIAMDDIRQEIEDLFNQLREAMKFKRKDLEASADKEGLGFIRTPAFDYTLQAALDDSDPTLMRWTREVTHISDPEVIRSAGFQQVFASRFDTLRFEFSEPLDVPAFVDRFEEEPLKGVKLRTSIDASTCDLTLEGFVGSIRLEPDSLVITGRSATAGSLIDQFFEFQRRFTKQSQLLALR